MLTNLYGGVIMPTVEELVRDFGYTRDAAEREWKRAHCEHEYAKHDDGTLCMWTPFGCTRTCIHCHQMTVDPNHCGQYDKRHSK